MNMISNIPDPRARAVSAFWVDHGEAARAAAAALGNVAVADRCLAALTGVGNRPHYTRHLAHCLVRLHRLLALDGVEDPDHPVTPYFLAIDPADPRVIEICMTTDRLRDLLEELAHLGVAEAAHHLDAA